MSRVNVSVILPEISSQSKFTRFCTSLFASDLSIELIACGELSEAVLAGVSESYADKIKLFPSASLSKALEKAEGDFVMFSDVNVTFAPNAIEKMIVASRGKAAVANASLVTDNAQKLFSENFTLDELASKSVYYNFLLSNDIIKANTLTLCGTDTLSIMLFIADYCRYDIILAVNEVLFYADSELKYYCSQSIAYLSEYANIFKLTANPTATLFFLRAVFSALLPSLNAESFDALKSVTSAFADDYLTLSWLKNTFGVDSLALANNARFEDFKYNGNGVFYKEVTLPVTPDSVVKNFYFGKFGIDVLKKCIGAWGYYKFYRRKDDFIKKFGCKLFKKLLGGDFDA